MTTSGSLSKLSVLIVDDNETFATNAAQILGESGISAVGRHPTQVTRDDVAAAQLIVVDEFLEEWDHGRTPAAVAPTDGIALAAVLRSLNPLACTAIVTGDLERLAEGVPLVASEHLVAAQRDVEWVFSKTDPDLYDRIASLARAASAIRPNVEPAAVLVAALDLDLGLSWSPLAIEQVTRCRPPLAPLQHNEVTVPTVRWLLQRVLPYPTFVLSDDRIALAMGLTVPALQALVDDAGASETLSGCLYAGSLSGFLGRRWWRAGIAQFIDDCADAGNGDFVSGVAELFGLNVDVLTSDDLVIPLGNELEELEAAPLEDCVRIFPDGWPAYADQAWALRADVESGGLLLEMVALADRDLSG